MAKTTTKEVIAPTRRRLTDLYVVGREVSFEIPGMEDEEPLVVWLSKLSPIQQRDAADSATSARAKLLALKNDPDSNPRQVAVIREQLEDLGVKERDAMIEFLISPKVQEAFAANEARIGSEGKWAKDDYLTSLQKAWNDGLSEKYATNEDDEDAKRVYDELLKFTEEVREATEEDREDIKLEFEHTSDEELAEKCLIRAIDAEADFAWVNEFSRWQIFYAVREPDDHKQQYFVSRSEVDDLDPKILNRLLTEYNEMTVDPTEGKD
jgi:hypothetical protein